MQDAKSILTSAGKFHINLGLERTLSALEKFDNPQNAVDFIHVAGTNGKGSVCAVLNEILCTKFAQDDINVGLFTSPHLFSYCERIKVNNKNISKEELDSYVAKVCAIQNDLTEFEILTVAAFLYFRDKKVKYAVLEVGLGGRYDSTNVITKPLCSIITTLDFDHTARLGGTINEIAYQKAGIIKPKCPVIISEDNRGLNVVEECARKSSSPLFRAKYVPKVDFDGSKNFVYINGGKYEFSLLGTHQSKNLSLVLEALKHLPFEVPDTILETALKNVRWKFRLEYDSQKKLLIDGAHNPSGILTLRAFLDEYFAKEKKTFIFGCLNNKDYLSMLKTLVKDEDELYFYEFSYPSALKFDELPPQVRKFACKTESPHDIIESRENLKIVCGSLYMLGSLFNPG